MKVLCLLRSLVAALIFTIFTFVWSALAIVAAFLPGSEKLENWVIGTWGKVALVLFGVDLKVEGLGNIPEGGCLFLFNHTSFFDVFAMLGGYNQFRFGAKIELFQIPIFGQAMRGLGILPIARANREEVFKVYAEAKERARLGEKFALSPEGRRNDRETLLPFKAGPFVFAINSQIPIVPVVIRGAHSVMSRDQWLPNRDRWKRKITLIYLPLIHSHEYSLDKRQDLQMKVYAEMSPYFSQNPISGS
jgi:1-acyl-sn-glycerol-3-phosphate acyltransferase